MFGEGAKNIHTVCQIENKYQHLAIYFQINL